MRLPTRLVVLVLLCSSAAPKPAGAQRTTDFQLWRFQQDAGSCRAKGRLQDREYCSSKTIDAILAMGKDAIPILIADLTNTRRTRTPIYDFWSYTAAGDIAHFILDDLFTDDDWITRTMPGIESLANPCGLDSQSCWRLFIDKHGRRFVQQQWQAAWSAHKDRMRWDAKARCFRLVSNPAPPAETSDNIGRSQLSGDLME